MATSKKLDAAKFDGSNVKHREMLAHMTTFDIGKLITDGADIAQVNFAAVNIADDILEATLRVYDAFLKVPFDDITPAAPVDATFWLLTARERKDPAFTKERARRYIARWTPYAKQNTLMYLNLATLHVALEQLPQAVSMLHEGLLEGDPNLASQIVDDDDLAILAKRPDFKALKKVEPAFPRALRGLELASACGLDEKVADAMMDCDLEEVRAHPIDNYFLMKDPRVGGQKAGLKVFQVFGSLPDGGDLAFWKRKPRTRLTDCPVVLFGSDGAIAVYARDFDGFLSLLSNGCKMHDVEGEGFRIDDEENWEPPSKRELTSGLKPVKALVTAIAQWSREAKKRKPATERAAAMALVPELMKELATLRGAKKKAKKVAAKAKKR